MDNTQSSTKRFTKSFPDVIEGKIDTVQFLEAAKDLVLLVESLGKVFAPVKYDMHGNVEKIRKCYVVQMDACLLQLMTTERSKGQTLATEGVLWLNRALLFFEINFQQIIDVIRSNNYNVSMTHIFTVSYEGSVKKYHNWASQKLFTMICKMCPNLQSILSSLGMDDDSEAFLANMTSYTQTLTKVRSEIDKYFEINKLFVD